MVKNSAGSNIQPTDRAALRARRLVNLAGVISGKALYEQRFTIREGQTALEEGS